MINLVRLGHYFTPGRQPQQAEDEETDQVAGSCRTALIIDNELTNKALVGDSVGLIFWNHNGGMEHRSTVLVSPPVSYEDSFHLSGDCPFGR